VREILSFTSAHPALGRALAAKNYVVPTPVQAAVLAEGASERDLLVSAQTGSGKTVAFGLAIAPRLLGEGDRIGAAGAPRALVVCPTRELALQVHRELGWLYGETGARITTCVGGMDPRREQQALRNGVHIVVGTPGRLCDHLERGVLVATRLEAVVLDEADEMLDMGFREDLERILDAAPADRRTLMFSATIPKPIAVMAKRYQKDALRIETTSPNDVHRDIEYHAVPSMPRERDLVVVNLLRYYDPPGALVFCATRDGVSHLASNLSERGFSAVALSGELSQRERNTALQSLRDRRARVCVATDVAARGLDLPDLGLVIHADLPQNAQVMVHRSGRTGRAGKHGLAILVVPDPARRYVERMLYTAHINATWQLPPSAEQIVAKDREQLGAEIKALVVDTVGDEDREIARQLLVDVPAEDLAAALVRIRRDARPAPEVITPPPSMRPRREENGPPRGPLPRAFQQRMPIRDERGPDRGPPRDHRAPDRSPPRDDRGPQRDDRASFGKTRDVAPRPTTTTTAAMPRPRGQATVPRPRDPVATTEAAPEHKSEALQAPERESGAVRQPRQPQSPSSSRADGVWFTVNVGRLKNADPKWLIPFLCRRGDVTKRSIGKIEIGTKETRVEISPTDAAHFAEAILRPDTKDKNLHIERTEAE
jgi:ATP-dependent RNA helicase DeaD